VLGHVNLEWWLLRRSAAAARLVHVDGAAHHPPFLRCRRIHALLACTRHMALAGRQPRAACFFPNVNVLFPQRVSLTP
jgi:hypothetical protein